MTPTGERLEVARLANDPAVLREQVAKAGPAPEVALEVALEATYGWYGRPTCWPPPARRCIWRIRWG